MNPLIYLVLALGIFAAGGAAGIKWHAGQDAIAENQRIAAQTARHEEQVARIDTAAVKHEDFKVAAAVRERIVKVEVDRVVEKPVYLNVCLDSDGLQLIAADIAARHPAASQPAPAVPGTAGADGNGRSGPIAVDTGSDPALQRVR